MHVSTPITALYAGALGILILVLAYRVVSVRRTLSIGLGDGTNEILLRAIRVHGNAVEYVPIALILMLVLELNGASNVLLHGLGVALLAGRIAHAQGLTTSSGGSPGRLAGVLLSWGVIVVAALDALLLSLR